MTISASKTLLNRSFVIEKGQMTDRIGRASVLLLFNNRELVPIYEKRSEFDGLFNLAVVQQSKSNEDQH
jgi:hypothetical protein